MKETIKYVTCDGLSFDDEDEAIAHETEIKIKDANIKFYAEDLSPVTDFGRYDYVKYIYCDSDNTEAIEDALDAVNDYTGLYVKPREIKPHSVFVFADEEYNNECEFVPVDSYIDIMNSIKELLANIDKICKKG